MLRVNFISAQGETSTVRFIGSEGVLEMGNNGFTIRHHKMPEAPGIGGWDALTTYPKAMQDRLTSAYDRKYPSDKRDYSVPPPTKYRAPDDYDEHLEHLTNFFHSVRTGGPVVEDAVFGFRAAAPSLLAKQSYFDKKIIYWDGVGMQERG